MAASPSRYWGPERNAKLEFWKEIAAYLKRQVRTVQLWEVMEGMPVHRHLHAKLCTVYAYESELDNWLRTRVQRRGGRKQAWSGVPVRRSVTPQAKSSTSRIMLAVLPFHNLSGDPEQEYFSDGLTEEMITQLSRLHTQQLGVIARTSAMLYKTRKKSTSQIARELGVNYILEGGVRRSGNHVRITARLVQVRDQTQLWAESYERDFADVFAIQSDVARQIARSLEVELLPGCRGVVASRPTANPAAYEAYLKGRYHWNKRTEEGLKKGVSYFEQAIQGDPYYALPYSGLADSFTLLSFYCVLHPLEAAARARPAAFKAVELDGTLGEAHTSLGEIKAFCEWDWAGAEQEYRRSIELSPSYATAYHWYANYLSVLGRHRHALVEFEHALAIDPISPILNVWMGMIFYYSGRFEKTIEHSQKALEIDPDYALAHWTLGLAYEQQGRYEEAVQELHKVSGLFKENSLMIAELGRVYAVSGKKEKARKILASLNATSKDMYVSSYHMAGILAGLQETELAFGLLRRTQEERSTWLPNLGTDPRMKGLRTDPRFDELLSKIGLSSGGENRLVQRSPTEKAG